MDCAKPDKKVEFVPFLTCINLLIRYTKTQ